MRIKERKIWEVIISTNFSELKENVNKDLLFNTTNKEVDIDTLTKELLTFKNKTNIVSESQKDVYSYENSKLPESIEIELKKLIPTVFLTIDVEYSDQTWDTKICIWDNIKGTYKDVIDKIKAKESTIFNTQLKNNVKYEQSEYLV